jgi:hypothetical protein
MTNTYKTIKITFQIPAIISAILQDSLTTLGLPGWIGTIVIIMVVATIVFLLIAAIMRSGVI